MKKIFIAVLLIVGLVIVYQIGFKQPSNSTSKEATRYSKVLSGGTVSFEKTADVDIEDWDTKGSGGLALVFVEKNKGSGLAQGGCGAGQQFIEITEEDSLRFKDGGSFKNIGKETFLTNTYSVFDFTLNEDEDIKYYVLPDLLSNGKKSI